jgi:hypothetical protein
MYHPIPPVMRHVGARPSPIHPIQRQQNMTVHNATLLAQRRTRPFALSL